jgi:hypothetical protein
MRISIVDTDAVILYDMTKPVHMSGCGRGHCTELRSSVMNEVKRYRVQRFWQIKTCPHCGRFMGYGESDRCLYLGNDEEAALEAYDQASISFLESAYESESVA